MDKELKVIDVNGINITVIDKENNKFILKMEIYNETIEKDTIILINSNLLDEIKDQFTSFGILTDYHGRNLKEIEKNRILDELIILYKNKETIYLKRLYG